MGQWTEHRKAVDQRIGLPVSVVEKSNGRVISRQACGIDDIQAVSHRTQDD
jgi:hypothetical protein